MYEKDFFERLNLQQLCAFLRTGGRLSPKAVGAKPPGGGCLGGRDESVP